MAKEILLNGVTSVILRILLLDTTSTTGGGKTGLTNSSSGLSIGTIADVEASTTSYTSAGSTIDSITTLGTFAAPTSGHCRFKEVDSTIHPGLYEIQIANARWAVSGARSIIITVLCTGAAPAFAEFQLSAADLNNATNLGLSAIPSAAAAAAGGLLTFGTSSGQLNPTSGALPLQSGQTVTLATGQLYIKKNAGLNNFMFYLRTSAGQPATGQTVTGQVAIDGGSFSNLTNNSSITEIANGWYKINLAAADTNGTVLALNFTASGAIPTQLAVITQP